MPEYPSTDEGKVPLVGDREDVMATVKNAYADMEFSEVDGIRVRYDRGWFLCRPSNTEPILVMRAEANDRPSLEEILTDIEARIGHVADIGKLK
jgi:phosphomannomutase/phosphoglucomutase